ncbi:putative D-xylose utilization operon transcriptional repressor [Propionicimonas sp. T2.31MG-18]|uniref:GntR family transcriptional regulator n=1 Tax=Propionicimonas sp. T2.31MG-18 TaxID=3157620 RepID=UPI0035E6FC84
MSFGATGAAESDRATLADRIYGQLEDEILSGELKPGSRLLIVPLAKRFGTSQAPVREAIRRLTEEGLAVTEPYVGTVLKEPSWNEVEEIYELRIELEAYAVRRLLARQRGTLKSDHPIRRTFRELQRAVRAGAPMGVVDADMDFHRAIVAAAESPVALEMWSTITKRIRGARLSYERRRRDDLSTMVDTHRDLLDAIEAGDPQSADEVFRAHLNRALDRLRDLEDAAESGESAS